MFGNNKLIGTDFSKDGKHLDVHSVFATVQGEGPHAGHPAVFVRLGYCNLRCLFCDTDFESDVKEMPLDALLDEIYSEFRKIKGDLVVITGGEPCRQNISLLVRILLERGCRVQIETAGTVWPPQLPTLFSHPNFTVVISPKTGKISMLAAEAATHFKYVVSVDQKRDADGLPIALMQRGANNAVALAKPPQHIPPQNVYLSPMDEQDGEKNLANNRLVADLAMKHGYTAGLQLHKYMSVE